MKRKQYVFTLSAEQYEWLRQEAQRQSVPISEMIRRIIDEKRFSGR